jgi:nucleoside-diphosphate-sugar epimerase
VQKLLGEIRPDVVFHLAGRVTAAPDLSLVFPTFCSLLMSTVNILVVAETVGCKRLVMTGSLTEPAAGVSEPIPSSPYAAAKWTGSAYARMFHQLYGTPVVIVRPFMTYGPRQQMEKIIPHVISSLLQGDRPRLSSGKWVADWIYVDDVIDGFMLAASKPTIDGCTIDLGSGTLTSVSVVVKKLVGLINPNIEPMFCSFADRPSESIRAADLGATTASLGWEPSTTLDQGLARTIEWYRDRLSK